MTTAITMSRPATSPLPVATTAGAMNLRWLAQQSARGQFSGLVGTGWHVLSADPS